MTPTRIFAALLFAGLLWIQSPLPQWLDSPELSTAVAQLGVSHPPGQPLYSMSMQIARWLPFGTLPLRLALVAAAMLLIAFWLIVRTVAGKRSETMALPLAVGVTAFSYAALLQTVRQELYVVNILCFAAALAAVAPLWHKKSPVTDRVRRGVLLAFVFGLAAANHTLLAIFDIGPLCIATLWLFRRDGWRATLRVVLWGVCFALVGLTVYLYLPLRAQALPPLNYGNPVHWADFLWVARGDLYQTYSHPTVTMFFDNFRAVLALCLDFFTPLAWLPVAYGWVNFHRRQPRLCRLLGIVAFAAIVAVLPNTAFDMANPDLFGYLLPAFAVIFLVGGYFCCVPWMEDAPKSSSRGYWLAAVTTLLLVLQLGRVQGRLLPYLTPETDRYSSAVLAPLPYGAVVSMGSYQTYGVLHYFRGLEGLRPDLTLQFRGDPRGGMPLARTEVRYFEPAIDKNSAGAFTIREGEERFSELNPCGWFFRPDSTPQSSVCSGLNQQEFWNSNFTVPEPWHPGLAGHLALGHYLHSLYYTARGNPTAAAWEYQAARLEE